MIRKKQLLEYCDCLTEDINELYEQIHNIKVELAAFHEKKNIDCVKRPAKKK